MAHRGAGHSFGQVRILGIQTKLTVGEPGDQHEQEADRVAEQVMRMPEPAAVARPNDDEGERKPDIQTKPSAKQITTSVQPQRAESQLREDRQETEKEAAEDTAAVQRQAEEGTESVSGRGPRVPFRIERALQNAGGGESLPAATREFFEPRFGHDFSRVRVHHDAGAAQLARTLHAQAFTQGEHVFFAAGRYVPESDGGRRLLAHELTHAVQQAGHRPLAAAPSPSAIAADRDTSSLRTGVRSGSSAIPVVRMRVEAGSHLARRDEDRPAASATLPPVIPEGTLLAVWGGLTDDDVEAKRIVPGLPPNGFDSTARAIAWASIVVVAQNADGAAIIASGGRFFVWEITVDDFTRSDVEGLTTLDTSASKVPGVVGFITSDGYLAPVTKFPSPSPSVPTYIVGRRRAGAYWHPTRFPSDTEFEKAEADVKTGSMKLLTPAAALALFRGVLRARALKRLQDNKQVTYAEEKKYADTGAGNAAWARLRAIIKKDRELDTAQKLAEKWLQQAKFARKPPMPGRVSLYNPIGVGILYPPAAIDAVAAELAQVKLVRATLRREYPAVAALDTSEIADSDANDTVMRMMREGMADARDAIDEAYHLVHEDDIPVNKLGPIVEEVTAELGITDAKRKAGDMASKAVLDWLERQDRKESIIRWVGTLFTIALTIGAFIATGGTAVLLGIAGSVVGVGTAVHEFNQASSMYTAAKAGKVGEPMVADAEQARFEYVMGWVNLVLAGLDLGLAARAAAPIVRGGLAAERMAGTRGAEILGKMKWQEVAQVERAFQLRAAGKAEEAEKILGDLRRTLGAETVEKAMGAFARRGAVDQLLGELTSDFGAAAMKKLKGGIGEEVLTDIGRDGVKALVAKHGVQGTLALKDKLGDALFHALAAPTGKIPGLAPKLLGELAEKVGKDVLAKVGPDALRALAGALQKGEELEKLIAKLGPDLTRRLGVTLGRDLVEKLGDKALLRMLDDLDPASWERAVGALEKLGTKNEQAVHKVWAGELESMQGARAHSLGRHGPEVTDPALQARVTSGVAPDLAFSPTKASTRFNTYKDWVETRQAAMDGAKSAKGVDVTTPPPPGGPKRVEVVVQHKTPIDDGFVGTTGTKTTVHDPTPGSTKTGPAYRGTSPVSDLTRTKTTFEWNPAANGGRGAWEMKQHFPWADGWNQATKTYGPAADYVVP